jgi:hypothetical protein
MEAQESPGVIHAAFVGIAPTLRGEPTHIHSGSIPADDIVRLASSVISQWHLPVRVDRHDRPQDGVPGVQFTPRDDVEPMTDDQLGALLGSGGEPLPEPHELSDAELCQLLEEKFGYPW